MTKTKKQLIAENEELLSRLVAVEETLKAIRSGEVDAIVVSGTKGQQVYTINSAETPYRTFVEEMHEGAVTLTKDGLILFCNPRFAEFVQEPIDCVIGSYLNRFITPDDKLKFDYLLDHQTYNKNDVLMVSLINSLFLKLSFHLLPPHLQGDTFILIATDISELKEKENELLKLHDKLKQHLNQLRDLRIDLINRRIEADAEINKLKIKIKKLEEEITKPVEIKLEQKPKQKKLSK